MTLVTESEIRQSVAEIENSSGTAIRKARLLVRLARYVRKEALRLAQGAAILASDCMDEQAERLNVAMQRLLDLDDEIRVRARALLANSSRESNTAIASLLMSH